jgi:hypothetical protein
MKKLKILNDFIKTINKDYKVLHDKKEFTSDWENGKVWVCFNENKEDDQLFMDYIKNKYQIEIDTFLMSFLHEIGHLETEDDELSDNRAIDLFMLEVAYDNGAITKEEYFNRYFEIECESLATEWGVDFYKSHEEQCKQLVKELRK